MVDSRVEAEIALDQAVLIIGAGNADYPGALDPGNLTGDASRGASRRRHDDRFARPRLSDVQHPEVRGKAGDAEDAHVVAERTSHSDRQDAVGRNDSIFLPPGFGPHDRAWRDGSTIGSDYFTQSAACHHFACAELLAIGPPLHPCPVGGIDRKQDSPNEQLARPGIADR